MAPDLPWTLSMAVGRRWALDTWLSGKGLGSDLVDCLGHEGVMANTSIADETLRWMVGQGWLSPKQFDPSFEQRFFGMGGRLYRGVHNPEWDANTDPQAWIYTANVSSVGYRDYIAKKDPLQALLVWQPDEDL